MSLKHYQQWFLWEDQTRENMGDLYIIYPFGMKLRTINIWKHSSKQWMLCSNLNFNEKIIIIKVTPKTVL